MKILKADFNGSSFHRVYFIGISFSFSYADRIIIRFSSQDNFPPLGPNSFVTSGFVLSIEELLISHVVHYMSILSRLQRRIFSRESSRLSKSGIEIWKFLTSYIRALLAPSLSLSLLFFRELPWGLHSDRVATGFSISAYIDAHQQHVHVTTAVCTQILQPPLSHIFAYHATVLGTTPFPRKVVR